MAEKAFCPGHVTGFFEICPSENVLAMGSRGAGMCLSLGATSTVEVEESKKPTIEITLDGKLAQAPVTRTALQYLLSDKKLGVRVDTVHDLPVSQGFGMSAAGAVSSSIALAHALDLRRQTAFEAAHIAEIRHKSGLGDVAAQRRGGITIRVKPGLPPKGRVLNIEGTPNVVLAVLGRGLRTSTILSNSAKRNRINLSGLRTVDCLLREPTLERLMELSYEFAIESGLATRRIIEATSAASKLGRASMAMLGNSVFAIGDAEGLARVLSEFGETWVCKVDPHGPRLIRKG
jgi:pantoate kinase